MILLYLAAGINHFINPSSYLKIIPSYLPSPLTLNYIAGIAEIVAGLVLFFPAQRRVAAWGIIILLVLFIPAHIYMIQEAPLQMGSVVITPLIAWIRLPLQLVLIAWAYSFTKK